MTPISQQYRIKSAVNNLTADSRAVTQGSLFLAYLGTKTDGRNYIANAIENGASAVIWDSADFEWNPQWLVENIAVKNLRLQSGFIAHQYYNEPSTKMWMIGVTGTNGKTSITHWLGQCFNYLNRKTAIIGTLGNGFADALTPTVNTTPDAVMLHATLAQFHKLQTEIVAMEVSSHGIHQGRINGVHFDVAVLSNLTRDHLDYHGTQEQYAAEKRRLFDSKNLSMAVLNADDEFGQRVEQELKILGTPMTTYGIDHGDVQASNIAFDNTGFSFNVTTPYGDGMVSANLIGRFNVYNILAVLATLLVSKVSLADSIMAINHITSAPGRMQQIGGGDLPLIVVDYAHTPDALEKVLTTLKEQLTPANKLICVFGCGGNRDAGKRELMGSIASRIANAVVVTSDNPRHENERKIIHDILQGIEGNYVVEIDRAKAISIAILSAKAGDIVLIAGKGHEDYQEINGIKHPFSDIEQVQQILTQLKGVDGSVIKDATKDAFIGFAS